ncbi:hypothetical protein CEXT_147741 [Caerostris extrusa]|uniref:Uncharacterized protein n=1 Tax=Caerostris extrusa TaxID=172846 RepID=A0AAV4PD34_CAEEX|nr:hypothetical protein CEXT_147741 [Caerostris extrusa]
MECVNVLGQGRPVSQKTTGNSPVGCLQPFLPIMEWVNVLGQDRPVIKYNWLQPGWLSPSYQIWNALTFLARVGLLAKYNWLQPGCCLLPIKYGMRQPSWPG